MTKSFKTAGTIKYFDVTFPSPKAGNIKSFAGRTHEAQAVPDLKTFVAAFFQKIG